MAVKPKNSVYTRIRQILELARATAARLVNTAQVVANWLIGREIVEEEQRGKRRAGYGKRLLQELSSRLTVEFGKGFSVDNLELCRRFFLEYPGLRGNEKSDAVRRKSSALLPAATLEIPHALRGESWQPGQLQFYVNYFDRERRTAGDQPTLGLILCTDINEAVVQYTLGPDQKKQIFTSRYKLHLPTEAELAAELRREVKALRGIGQP